MYYVSQKPRDKHVLGKLEYCFLLKRNEENKSFPKIEILIIQNWGPVKIVIIVMRKIENSFTKHVRASLS